jgi:C-terminal processing protease CtpA/Prc
LAWAQSLPDAAERDRALAAIRQAAPVGIGAVLSRDDGGYPVIREVLPGGAVSKSAAIAEGSQIAAVRDASGQFIETKDRELSDIIPLLRGAPGTLVAVQVIPPGGTFADRRTVVLTREQLLFKR